MRLKLINPNTNTATTAAMLAIARDAAAPGTQIDSATAATGAPLILTPEALAVAENAVLALLQAGAAEGYDGVIIAAFGDPGLARAKALLPIPVTGIAEAGMLAAAEGGRRFAVVTTTPNLAAPIAERAAGYGLAECFGGVHVTPGDPPALMADPEALDAALFAACQTAIAAGARAIVIGGGPLAVAARRLSGRVPVPLIEPVVAAVRLAERRAR